MNDSERLELFIANIQRIIGVGLPFDQGTDAVIAKILKFLQLHEDERAEAKSFAKIVVGDIMETIAAYENKQKQFHARWSKLQYKEEG